MGCDSNINLTGTPAAPPVTAEAGVPALLSASSAGQVVTIQNPSLLPEAVRTAGTLEAAVGGVKVVVSRNAGGYYTFAIPASAKTGIDVAGNLKVVFIIDDTKSQIVTLKTGSPVPFGQPPVVTDPSPAFVTRGLDVNLTANTDADLSKYQLTWAVGQSATGPFTAIPGEGKQVKWTPTVAGNYFVKIDVVDRASQATYSTVTPQAVVFVTEGRDVVTTEPASGSIARGASVKLKFNRPTQLANADLSYSWSVGASAQGPFTAIQGNTETVDYLPTNVGNYFVKVDVTNKATGAVNTFTSPQAVVFVSEGQPIITPSTTTVERGGKVDLTLNVADPGPGPFTWYYSTNPGQWVLIPGNGKTNTIIVNPAGSYNFRVDISQATGGVKTFTTTDPVLNVIESHPLIQTDPVNLTVKQGETIPLVLTAAGVDESSYRYVWSYSANPQAGWTTIPFDNVEDQYKKRFAWKTISTVGNSTIVVPPGAYYVKVDAIEKSGTNTYTSTSRGPVANNQR
jgi:hypothetical protein